MPEASSDPNRPPAAFGIVPGELKSLLKFLDARICAEGCDGTVISTERWAEANDVGWSQLLVGLTGSGISCDCEILARGARPFDAA
ncbi:DUF2695 domain-containing protein [Amycolatopsis sp. PS_44_ISF1]|uniref:DUF2695 domain-containing protein n=1 Tax=Amycolatopsis sp. PS_44_ISF1 TaxID=2974917 RepID=UPI0028E002D2|nr:DUF2695 domain-containing protein [Amycolatopsis sp. PS_44_ISF1]MDT8910171.1 DUF2695 domain-containing protein [Amycolatopsis sp. PS_44_ISF1]